MSRRSRARRKQAGRRSSQSGIWRTILIFVGLLALTVAIWVGLGLISALPDGLRLGLQIGSAVLILGVGSVVLLIGWLRRRRAAAEIEEEILSDPGADEAADVTDRMRRALEKLKKSRGFSSLYDLPWYVIIGPPGAGKTTALRNSGVEFIGAGDDEELRGFGGTRNCDWWLGEEAILIDTAGRYVSQDSDTEVDRAGWAAFLEKLKQTRPKQPINGVILAISIDELLGADEHGIAALADTLRRRLAEVRETLRIDFPVYMLFTKADKISGFREFVARFPDRRRRAVWGTTFESTSRDPQVHASAEQEYDALVERLSAEIVDRMDEEPDLQTRIKIFGLAGQMAGLKHNILDLLDRVFKPSRHSQNAILRGFYFASGTQEGTAIDLVLGEMEDAPGSGLRIEAGRSGLGLSYFLHDLLREVIFAERDWVSYDQRAVRRATGFRIASLTVLGLATFLSLAFVAWTAWDTRSLFAATEQDADTYLAEDFRASLTQVVNDPDLTDVLDRLDQLRALPLGEAPTVAESGRWWRPFFLIDPRADVRTDSATAYGTALEVLLRPRVVMLAERELRDAIEAQDTARVYSSLKTYILLHPDDTDERDDAHLRGWFDAYLQRNSALRFGAEVNGQPPADRLRIHFAAMLESGVGQESGDFVARREAPIDAARDYFGFLNINEIAMAIIEAQAEAQSAAPDFPLRDVFLFPANGLSEARQVFRTRDGSDLGDLNVGWVYTVDGYLGYFADMVDGIRDTLESEVWVISRAGGAEALLQEIGRLEDQLYPLYRAGFAEAWRRALDNLEVNTLNTGTPFVALGTAASRTESPIRDLVRIVTENTRLSEEDLAALEAEAEGGGDLGGVAVPSGQAGAALGGAARFVGREIARRQRDVTRRALDEIGRSGGGGGGGGAAGGQTTMTLLGETLLDIESDFEGWHRYWISAGAEAPNIDAVLNALQAIRLGLLNSVRADLSNELFQLGDAIRGLPEPLRAMMVDVEREFREGARDQRISEMNNALNADVYSFCARVVNNRFPMDNASASMSIDEFAGLFNPNGRMATYFDQYLSDHVLVQNGELVPDPNSDLAPLLSANLLQQFSRARRIEQAFFANGGTMPSISVAIQLRRAPNVENLTLTIEGGQYLLEDGRPASFRWTGLNDVATLSARVGGAIGARTEQAGASQPSNWSIIRLIDSARARSRSGDTLILSYLLGGEEVVIAMTITGTNPFTMPELRQFACPLSVD
jgi:type VI secretion system protein ImpL